MKKLEFEILINALPADVWSVIIGHDTYQQWTKPFSESSTVETNWEKGSRALFTDGSGSGMIAEIAENIPAKFLSIRHLGILDNGKEDFDSEETKNWQGAMEDYKLEEINGKTAWTVHVDMVESMIAYMNEAWPKAMEIVKNLAEQRSLAGK
jgi:hypothetical protein